MWPVRFYQLTLSWLLGGQCRFEPSCSRYALQAIAEHGAVKGWGLALWRLLRCQPFCKGGYDPVPPARNMKGPDEPGHETPREKGSADTSHGSKAI